MSEEILVFMDWGSSSETECIGTLRFEQVRGRDIFSFSGNKAWLAHKEFRMLDPGLGHFEGPQYLAEGKRNFGLFLDSAPDRWGRTLIKRREALSAQQEQRAPKTLTELDFLLGVYDGNRMGALRFKRDLDGPFLDSNRDMATPPWASIRDLEYASLQIEKDNSIDMPDYGNWLAMLVKPGSSLGGARPKATIVDKDGSLWIAKFPSAHDEKDTGAWEKVLHELAASSGISVPESRARVFTGKHHTFLTKRFDRSSRHHRIHFASAMTLLGEDDGADYSSGASYLDMASFICRFNNNVEYNLEELWRRMVFNIAVSNCDDHLRNHGFILRNGGWELSPAYDMNPDETGTGLTLNISENDNSLDFDLAMSVIPHFRLSPEKAQSILGLVKKSVSFYRNTASKYGISRVEQEMAERAFRY